MSDAVSGKISSAQIVGTFGVGSLYDLRDYSGPSGQTVTSVTIAGIDEWEKHRSELPRISEPSLQHALRVKAFYGPPPMPDNVNAGNIRKKPSVPVHRFPLWMVCSNCSRLGRARSEFDARRGGNRCLDRMCGGHGVPVRLVTTCFPGPGDNASAPHPGHIDEFPWHQWAHSRDPENACPSAHPKLKLVRSGDSAALSGLRVICLQPGCSERKVGRNLDGVFGDTALRGHVCRGHRPWLQDSEGCGRPVRALMRGASNVYFAVTASALSIPPNSSSCRQAVADSWAKIRSTVEVARNQLPPQTLVSIAVNANAALRRYPWQQVWEAIVELSGDAPAPGTRYPASNEEQRALEHTALVEGRQDENSEAVPLFDARPVTRDEIDNGYEQASGLLSRLVLVHRLREVRALRGFQRLNPASGGDPYTVGCAPLSRTPKDWLPAIEVYGEGIYFELDSERTSEWARRPVVVERVSRLERKRNKAMPDSAGTPLTPQFALVHTLAHLLINQLSLDCGYSSSSLRERLYVGMDERGVGWCGALIYTATTAADGTLGGLVRQGQPDLFGRTLHAAVENATWCSSDPLCIESTGQGVDALNLAACHACAIASETSCEHRNMLLDRAFVVGTPDRPDLGFFSGTALLASGA